MKKQAATIARQPFGPEHVWKGCIECCKSGKYLDCAQRCDNCRNKQIAIGGKDWYTDAIHRWVSGPCTCPR